MRAQLGDTISIPPSIGVRSIGGKRGGGEFAHPPNHLRGASSLPHTFTESDVSSIIKVHGYGRADFLQ